MGTYTALAHCTDMHTTSQSLFHLIIFYKPNYKLVYTMVTCISSEYEYKNALESIV